MNGSMFVSALELFLVDSSYYVENLNGSIGGLEDHSVIESFFLVAFSQSLGGNLN